MSIRQVVVITALGADTEYSSWGNIHKCAAAVVADVFNKVAVQQRKTAGAEPLTAVSKV
jgi:hypothetical protein